MIDYQRCRRCGEPLGHHWLGNEPTWCTEACEDADRLEDVLDSHVEVVNGQVFRHAGSDWLGASTGCFVRARLVQVSKNGSDWLCWIGGMWRDDIFVGRRIDQR